MAGQTARVAGIIIKMELHILVLLVPTMLLMVRWLATVLWSGRAKDITSEKMENILSIPGVMVEEAMQLKMVHLYVVDGKRLTESSTISIGKAYFIHISIMEKVFSQGKVPICHQMATHRAGS